MIFGFFGLNVLMVSGIFIFSFLCSQFLDGCMIDYKNCLLASIQFIIVDHIIIIGKILEM